MNLLEEIENIILDAKIYYDEYREDFYVENYEELAEKIFKLIEKQR